MNRTSTASSRCSTGSSAKVQFVIITHNKRTIAMADVLYGVTMEEHGVSKLVGLRLTNAKPAEESTPVRATSPAQQKALDFDEAGTEKLAVTR